MAIDSSTPDGRTYFFERHVVLSGSPEVTLRPLTLQFFFFFSVSEMRLVLADSSRSWEVDPMIWSQSSWMMNVLENDPQAVQLTWPHDTSAEIMDLLFQYLNAREGHPAPSIPRPLSRQIPLKVWLQPCDQQWIAKLSDEMIPTLLRVATFIGHANLIDLLSALVASWIQAGELGKRAKHWPKR